MNSSNNTPNMDFQVEKIEDVKVFLSTVIKGKLGLSFHPDDPFDGYRYENGERVFSDKEAESLQKTFDVCWNVCDQEAIDLYEIAWEITEPLLKECKPLQ